jgi:Chitobiase/beta-hexosaminidase C-terminal domain/Bacterial Ig-like domain (group 2)
VALLCGAHAHAANYPIAAGASQSTIQSTINSAAAAPGGNTVTFAAGIYSVTQITVPCPASPLTITGPATNYPATQSARPTATLNSAYSGEAPQTFAFATPCSTAITFTYLEVNGGRPTSGGGAIYVGNQGMSNLTIEYNYLHGNQEIVPVAEGTSPNQFWAYDDPNANLIRLDGYQNGATDSNITIEYNILGNLNVSNPLAGDCSNVITWIGGNLNSPPAFKGYDVTGGNCVGIGIYGKLSNVFVEYNVIQEQEQGMKFFEGGSASPNLYLQTNVNLLYNDFSYIHRIGVENQGSPTGSTPFAINYNDFHDMIQPNFGSWTLSMAACCLQPSPAPINHFNNVFAGNGQIANQAGPGTSEWWSGPGGVYGNNYVQGYYNPGMQFGFYTGTVSITNNTFQLITSGASPINSEEGLPVPVESGNVSNTGVTMTALTSVAPTISPGAGAYTSPPTITLTDPGYTSGSVPQGNTSIWYTTDGSTPVPGAGTATRYTAPFLITVPATVRAVGMWGAVTQPVSYPSGYGFVPSAVQSAAYTASGGVTLSSVSLTNTGAIHSLVAGGSLQMTATCLYSNGATTNCTSTDAYGNAVSTWSSSNTAALSISSGGLMTGVAAGTANVTAVVASLTTPAWAMTVTSATLPLSSIALATTGGITRLPVGGVSQLLATCTYADSSTTNCSTADAHGNVVNPWTSSAPAVGTVNSTGVATGVAAGSTNLTATVNPSMVTSQWGQTASDAPGTTTSSYINSTYFVFGSQPGGYSGTGGTCSFYLPSGTLTNGSLFDCGLIPAPTPTTQSSSWLCWGTYTVSGTSAPGAFVTVPMNSCGGNIASGSAEWIGVATNSPGTPGVGFDDCGGTCNGSAPTLGIGTYPYYCVANPYGSRTGMSTTMLPCGSGGGVQASQYVTMGQPPIVSNAVPLMVTAAAPTLLSAYLATPGSATSMVVGGTLQFSAKCVYSDSSTTDCTVADVHGNAVTTWSTSDATKVTVGAVGSANPGLATAIAPGTPSIQANVGSVVAPAFNLTISAPAVNLTGISIATSGGVTGVFLGQTNQLIATCLYSDGSTTNCTTTDSHGNVASAYSSATPAHATVNATSGLVTAVAVGTTMLTGTAGSFTSTAIPLAVLAMPSGVYIITITGPVKFSGTVQF